MTSEQEWWSMSGAHLLTLLKEAHAGADPDLLYVEEYANSDAVYITEIEADDE
jgi:hypothetical protein